MDEGPILSKRVEEIRKQIATSNKPVKVVRPPYQYPVITPIECGCGIKYHPYDARNTFGGFCWPCDIELLYKIAQEHNIKKDEFLYEVATDKLRSHHNITEAKKRKVDTAFPVKIQLNTVPNRNKASKCNTVK
jgi:hypothetical protein